MKELYMVIVRTQDDVLLLFDHNVEHDVAVKSYEIAKDNIKPKMVWIVPQAREYKLT